MPNGDYFSDEEWNGYLKQLEPMRHQIKEFAAKEGIEATFYYHGWPHLILEWLNAHHIKCQVTFSLNPENKATYDLVISGRKDINNIVYSTKRFVEKNIKPPFEFAAIINLIKNTVELCNSFKDEHLSSSKTT